MDVRLDKRVLKALASDTRVELLKILGSRRHMQSELAGVLGLSVPTVKEHLEALEKAGLVERFEEGRKWKYYALTKQGRGVLEPERVQLLLVLGTFVLSVVGGLLSWQWVAKQVESEAVPMMAQAQLKMAAAPMAQEVARSPEVSVWVFVFGCIAVVSLLVLIILLVRRSAYQKHLGKSLTKKEGIY